MKYFYFKMKQMKKVSLICLLFLLPCVASLKAQTSPWQMLEQLRAQYAGGDVSPTALARQYDSLLVPVIYAPGVEKYLEVYRVAAFSDSNLKAQQCNYYHLAASHAIGQKNAGMAVCYNEQALQIASQNRFVQSVIRSYQFIITLYINNQSYEKALQKFSEIAPVCNYVVKHTTYASEPKLINQITVLYSTMAAYFQKTGNLNGLTNFVDDLAYIRKKAARQTDALGAYWYNIQYQYLNAMYYRYTLLGDTVGQFDMLYALRNIVSSKGFPAPQQEHYRSSVNIRLANLYASLNTDSSQKYLGLYRTRSYNRGIIDNDISYYQGLAGTFQKKGDYARAYAALNTSRVLVDSLLRNTISDLNKSLFAQTELLQSREHLEEARREKIRMTTFTWIMALAFLSFVLAVLVIFYRMRYNQNKKYTEARVNLARNVHDQIGPMLFYSKMLVVSAMQKNRTGKVDLKELEEQLTNTLNTVRDLSRELKQDKAYFSRDLVKETEDLLRKTKRVTGVDYSVDCDENSLPLSFEKYNQLLRVMQELVNNSVKHADSSHINVKVSKTEQTLQLDYCDDGKGFPAGHMDKDGQGLSNIKARVAQIKGRIHINNQYPQGYDIKIVVPL